MSDTLWHCPRSESVRISGSTGWAKLNGANAVSFIVVKHMRMLIIFCRWNIDSSTAAAAETKSKCRISKIWQKFSNHNFENWFHMFCVLPHRSRVPSFVRIRQKNCSSSDLKIWHRQPISGAKRWPHFLGHLVYKPFHKN